MTRINIYILAICSLLFAGVIGHNDYRESNKLYFVVYMESSNIGISQIFFDIGHGVTEQDSSRLQVQRGAFQKYLFPLPTLPIKNLRFDLIDAPSVLRINKAGIENASGDILKNYPVKSFKSKQQISGMDVIEDMLVIHTVENANDPITEIENSSFNKKSSWIDFLAHRGWIYAGYALLIFTIFIGLAKCRRQIAETIERLVNYSVANPRKAIAFIGLISAVASCYPVVFFGKSFVSPVGVAALYGAPPWVPGFSFNGFIENYRGSDLGATLWSIAPNTVVQHDSLFRYFEFPFWNRYVGGGIPLFAQGQSMIGDVLHWIPVFLDGSSIGWDFKFILSKAIFAVGMGLLVFRFTDRLLAGLLIAISSCFLGFFAYRFNHPVFFVLTYAPWVVLQWDRLGRVLTLPNPHVRSCVSQGLLLAAVTWLQLNAGPPKEGVITACFMQALGVLAFLVHISPKWGRIRSFVFAFGIGFTLVMITAPHWLLFLDALGKAFTSYDTPGVSTFQPWMIIGFFDNFFFQKYFNNNLTGPSVNLFIFFCMASSFISLRLRQSCIVCGSWGLFVLAMSTAYGLIPVSILIAIPFINKVHHVGDTFSVPMTVLALIIAGHGIRDFLEASDKFKKAILAFSISSFLGLWLVLIWQNPIKYSIEERYIVIVFIVLIGLVALYQLAGSGVWKKRIGLIILTCCFLVLNVRHGMHLMTGVATIDAYVMNSTERANYSNKSNAIEYVKKRIDKAMIPTRVVGEREVLFPGFNARLDLEGIVPVEPLRSKNYEKLLTLIDYPMVDWGWCRRIKSDQITSRAASLDLLGIGYMVADVGTKMPQDMQLLYSRDLDVWQRESVWPRAFFVNKIIEVHKPTDIIDALADKKHVPFAAVESQFIPQGVLKNNTLYRVIPAGEYRLTNNSTRFSVEASGPGIIVLGETYYPGDFVANVNGEKVDYIRVNEASKGIWVNKAGEYDVSFTYRPEKLNQAILICLCGLMLLLLLIRMSIGIPKEFVKL
ncbi:MAG: hypothetical protein M0R70_08740 [Nitrospirae bacterium]|nr:hypothetical protein [Nitrospirota bacterium]